VVNFKAFEVNFEGKAQENTRLAGALPDFGLQNPFKMKVIVALLGEFAL
jgi:hypothetical protein